MDATRRRRTRDEARRRWYGRWRQERFARSAFRPGTHQMVPCADAPGLTVALLSREGESWSVLIAVEFEDGRESQVRETTDWLRLGSARQMDPANGTAVVKGSRSLILPSSSR